MEKPDAPDYTFQYGTFRCQLKWKPTTPPPPSPHIITRQTAVAAIATALDTASGVCVLGVAGTGKSILCETYARLHTAQYPGGMVVARIGPAFVPAAHASAILRSWMLQALDVPVLPESVSLNPSAVHTAWYHAPRMLVVFEDVVDATQIETLRSALPPHAQTIITTRSPGVAAALGVPIIALGAYTPDDARAALCAQLGISTPNTRIRQLFDRLAARVEHHPPAVALVGSALNQAGTDPLQWESLVEALLHDEADTFYPRLIALVQHPLPTLPTRDVSALHPIDRQILLSFACCASEFPVPRAILHAVWGLPVESLHACLERLEQNGLIRAVGQDCWELHSWLRAWLRVGVGDPLILAHMTQRILGALAEILKERADGFSFELPAPIYQQFQTLLAEHAADFPDDALLLIQAIAPFHRATGQHEEQLHISERFLEHAPTALVLDAALVRANALVDHAAHIGQQRRNLLDEAQAIYAAASAAIELMPFHPLRAVTLQSWAICLQELADAPGVDRTAMLNEILALCRSAEDDPHLAPALFVAISQTRANALHDLAKIDYPHGNALYEAAIECCTSALAYIPRERRSEQYVRLQGTLASLYRDYADCADVDRPALLAKALEASREVAHFLDETHDGMRYARELMNQANIYADIADCLDVDQRAAIDRAIQQLEESLTYRTALEVPLEYAWTQHNLAVARLTEAQRYYATQEESLQLARTAMTEALRFRTSDEVPTHAFLSHYYMALILRASADAVAADETRRYHYLKTGIDHCSQAHRLAITGDDAFGAAATEDVTASLLWRLAVCAGTDRDATLAHAAACVQRAIDFYASEGLSDDRGECLLTAAQIAFHQQGPTAEVCETLREALVLTAGSRFCELPIRAAVIAAEIYAASSNPALHNAARRAATDACALAKRLGHVVHLHRAEAVLAALDQR